MGASLGCCAHAQRRMVKMAAPKKLTPEAELEIIRRRQAGESIQSIARDFPIVHQTVSKLVRRHARFAMEQAEQSQSSPGEPAAPVDQGREQTNARQPALASVFSSGE